MAFDTSDRSASSASDQSLKALSERILLPMVEEISFAISVIHPVYRNFAVEQGAIDPIFADGLMVPTPSDLTPP
jgi:hypothetical protein